MIRRRRVSLTLSVALLALGMNRAALTQDSADPVRDAQQLAAEVFDDAAKGAGLSDVDQAPLFERQVSAYNEYYGRRQLNTLYFALILAVTALLAHFFVLQSLRRDGSPRASSSIVSATGLIYIIFGTILLVVIASTEAQLTASMGILGAVAGYLFGKNTKEEAVSP